MDQQMGMNDAGYTQFQNGPAEQQFMVQPPMPMMAPMAPPASGMMPTPAFNAPLTPIDALRQNLCGELFAHKDALPNGFNQDRFILNAMAMVEEKKKELMQVEPQSLVMCLVKGAYLGLDFLNKECYAIAYGGKASFQTDYKGEIKLAKKYSKRPIAEIYAKNVRDGDQYEEVVINGQQSINFTPKPFSNAPIVGTFAVVKYEDGGIMWESMSKGEIEEVRNSYSKAANSQAWKKSAGEMYKKTVIRRLLKMVELDFDNTAQILAFEDGAGMRFENPNQGRDRGPWGGNDTVADVF